MCILHMGIAKCYHFEWSSKTHKGLTSTSLNTLQRLTNISIFNHCHSCTQQRQCLWFLSFFIQETKCSPYSFDPS